MIGERVLVAQRGHAPPQVSQRPSWKKAAGVSRSAGAARGTPGWLEHRPGPGWEGKAARVAGLIILALSVPLLLAAWVYLFPKGRPLPVLVLTAWDYRAPCPPNAFAADDAARFVDVFAKYDNLQVTKADEPRNAAGLLRAVEGFLADSSRGGPDQNAALIYVSAHGVVNDGGEPCLVLPGDDPLDSRSWMRLADLLNTIAESSRATAQTTVLLLDAHRIADAWRMGIVANTFALALDELMADAPPRNCVVIAAASGLQSSATAPEISGTPFGYFAMRGLRGAADVEGDGNRIVTLRELESYLTRHVDAWASQHRGLRQQPRRASPGDEDVRLADVAGEDDLPTRPWKPAVDASAMEQTLERIERLEQSRVVALNPLAWAKAHALLEQLDAEMLGGHAYEERCRTGTLTELHAALGELEGERPYQGLKPFSLALYERFEESHNAGSLDPVWQAWLKGPDKTKVPAGYEAAATMAWRQVCEGAEPLSREALEKRLEFCRLAGAAARDEYTETALLRLLLQHVDWDSPALSRGVPQRLLAGRRESERLAAPADARQHYALSPVIRPLDESLSTAFDQVLIGDDDALHLADQRLTALLGSGPDGYAQVRALSDLVLRALSARDDALAAALNLNQWVARRAKFDGAYRTQVDVRPLARDARELSARLDDVLKGQRAVSRRDRERLERLTESVESALGRLTGAYIERVAQVAVEEEGSRSSVAVETPHLLACPLGFGAQRARLRRNWLEQLTQQAKESSGAAPVKAIDERDELGYLRWLVVDGVAPLRELLAPPGGSGGPEAEGSASQSAPLIDSASSAGDVADAIAELGARVRRRLRELSAVCQQLVAHSNSMLPDRAAREARIGLSEADALSRGLAALAAPTLRFGLGAAPAALLRMLDQQAWIVWHGDRLTDDFWGDWQAEPGGSRPYFATAAAHALEDAERLLPEASFGASELRRRLATAESLLRSWNPLEARDLYVAEDGGPFLSHAIGFRGEPDMPRGQAAVFLADSAGKLFSTYSQTALEVRRVGVPTRETTSLDNRITPEALGNVPVLYANALFRGHVKRQVFSVGRGGVVQWEKPRPIESRVTVRGDSKQVSQIVIVLDCSASMGKFGRDRLKEGRQVLRRLLAELLERGEQFRIGLVLYGRRAGWEERPPNSGKWFVKHLNAQQFRGAPGSDVEVAFRLAPLVKDYADEINSFLEDVRELGETPLYYALSVALEQFDADIAGPRHVLAITDGVDDVTVDARFPVVKYAPKDVMKALGEHPARIDVIEFGVDMSKLSARELGIWPSGRRDLEAIAQSELSGGRFRRAQQAADLQDELLSSLRLDRFRLQPVGNDPPLPWNELGATARAPAAEARRDYIVDLQTHDPPTAQIQIEGGEALELIYRRPPENRLIYPIYEAEDQRARRVAGGRVVASHLPALQLADPVFRVSVQSGDELVFSARPEVIWARVEPLDEQQSRSHYFLDREFEPNLPAPMLNLRASGWSGGKFARVELAFAMKAEELPARWFAIPQLGAEEFAAHSATLRTRSEIAGRWRQIVVDEHHAPESEDFPLHLELDPMPDSISRTFFESNRSARHVFRYAVQPASPRLRVLTRREIEAGGAAVSFDRVELPRQ